ncbi:MAG TPA: hypothetical protein VF137_08500 [Candidatus Dormibacteraeota bacterium]
MRRVLHYRFRELPEARSERLEEQFASFGEARDWRSSPPWVATENSRGLFESEYLRHLQLAEGADITAAGFLKMAGDETDALTLTFFLRDLSAEYGVDVTLRDEDNPLAKLRRLDFRAGRLQSGLSLEETLARRPVIKKVRGESILFYPPTYRLHSQAPPGSGEWGYALCGLRAYAPSLLEAEREALKILRGLRHLGA